MVVLLLEKTHPRAGPAGGGAAEGASIEAGPGDGANQLILLGLQALFVRPNRFANHMSRAPRLARQIALNSDFRDSGAGLSNWPLAGSFAISFSGATRRDRTGDLRFTKPPLYQLS